MKSHYELGDGSPQQDDPHFARYATHPRAFPGVTPFTDRGSQFPGTPAVGLALWHHTASMHHEMGVGIGPYYPGDEATFIPHGQIEMVIQLLEIAKSELEEITGRDEKQALRDSRTSRHAAARRAAREEK